MTRFFLSTGFVFLVATGVGTMGHLGTINAADSKPSLDPKALTYQLPDQIKWVKSRTSESAILSGDPSKPGLYVMLVKWLPHNMSRPHTHPNDRYISVISGTWYVGTGTQYDPNSTVGMPAGSFVTHHAGQPHYDGAKDTEAVIEIFGMGPETSTSVEVK